MKLQMPAHEGTGLLITFCGLDGCGKTTQIALLHNYLQDAKFSVSLTRQPTDSVRKSDIFRTYMDKPDHSAYDYRALSLLCASDRVQHTNHVIRPLLSEGTTVVSDRYFYSCLANLRARGYTEDTWIYDVARSIVKPDVALFLDVPVEIAVTRVRARSEEKDKYIDMELQYRLRKEYLTIARENGGIIINSEGTPEQTYRRILSAVSKKVGVGKLGVA